MVKQFLLVRIAKDKSRVRRNGATSRRVLLLRRALLHGEYM